MESNLKCPICGYLARTELRAMSHRGYHELAGEVHNSDAQPPRSDTSPMAKLLPDGET